MAQWLPKVFTTSPGGVSSAVTPDLLPPGQLAWAMNASIRGAKPHTRPPIVERLILPEGLHQSSGYFGVQGGMIVTNIAGRIYRLRIGTNTYSYEEIPLGFVNSGVIKQTWQQQTIETLVIQDGQSNAILYNGSTARRAGPDEVPRGTSMAYGNGRLWVAINKNELVAGDIRTRIVGSELFFTETNYLSGGGALYFPRGLTGLEFIPITGAADFGTLIVFSKDSTESVRADVTNRDMWPNYSGFVTTVFRDIGCAGDWSITQVNQDLYWRDSRGDIRSLANAISTSSTPGSTPISREVQRLVDYDSDQLLPWVSSVYFDNRFLQTSSPYLNVSGGVSFKDIVALDFSPISTMQLKAPPAYDGQWSGPPGIAQLVAGQFDGQNRAFAITSGEDGINRLWEILTRGRDDAYLSCGSGGIFNPIESFIEYPSFEFSLPKNRKRLERCDVWLSDIDGDFEMRLYWRTDNAQKWTQWDESAACATTTDAATDTPHVWKNLLPQQRPQIKSYTIPDSLDEVTRYANKVGFEFQIRIAFTGKYQVERMMVYATDLGDKPFADIADVDCLENDVTGNSLNYTIPTNVCITPEEEPIFEQYTGPFEIRYLTQSVDGDNRQIFSFAFLGVDHSNAAGLVPLTSTTNGLIYSEWSGTSTYDPNTDTYTGELSVTRYQAGVVPAGVNFYENATDPITVTADTFDELFAAFQQIGGSSFGSRSYTEGTTADGTFVRKWFSETPGPTVDGYFAGYTMGRIWSDGWTLTVTYSDQQTPAGLGLPITLTGEGARTQHITGYDPNTFTYTGTKSRVRQNVVIPSGKTTLYGEFKYLVTPDDGSDPYYYYDSQEYTVMGGTTYNAVTWFPWIVDAVVYYVSGTFSFTPTYYVGFSSAVANREYTVLPPIASWPETFQFVCPPRNADSWDDFDDYGGTDTDSSNYLIALFTGYAWADAYIFVSWDPTDAYDDFQAYADGDIPNLTQGVGFYEPGFFVIFQSIGAYDDFESYADGAITTLTYTSDGNCWFADGFFAGP